ncbi:MAG: succinate dehydrogenase cytochrome b subunit [Desulfobacteraceae bacterium]|nr:succinate dehydrogenase cytochrome b subunit [Desulfobacteraceae bacterium]MCF8094598.1 succinate dehydrogenase cytochrome b subunit [Desulfobacteraceae bacterium]
MNWFIENISTAVGKKLIMAVTGMGFVGFILVHLVGNLSFYFGKEAFLAYVETLHKLDPLILVIELVLLALAVIHVTTGTVLFIQNWRARSTRYAVTKSAGGRTIGSRTMPYTGFFILLYVILHLLQFHFIDRTQMTPYDAAVNTFASVWYTLTYIAAVILVGLHIRHGFWSLFQTLGLNHEKYMPVIQTVGILFAIAAAVGFAFVPIYIRAVT